MLVLFSFVSVIFPAEAVPPDFSWVKTATGLRTETSYDMAVDANGTSIIAGYFNSTNVSFGSVTLTNSLAIDSPPRDCFVAKFDPDGNAQWAKSFGGTGEDYAFAVAVDTQGNSYVGGQFGSTNFSVGSTNLMNQMTNGNPAFFVAKLDSSGNVLWAKCPDTNYSTTITGLAVDSFGNVFAAGNLAGTNVIDGTIFSSGSNTLTDALLLKYDSSGTLLWTRQSGGSARDSGDRVAVDDSGAAYLLVQTRSTNAIFGGIVLTNNDVTFNNIAAIKYNAAGDVLWAKLFGGESGEIGRGLAVDQMHNCYITGDYQSTNFVIGSFILTNASSFSEMFLAKLDPDGVPLWAKAAHGYDFDTSWKVAVDQFGNSYIGGSFQSTNLVFDTMTLTNSEADELIPAPDAFIAKFDVGGNILWTAQPIGANEQRIFSLALDADANVYATGWTQGTNVLFGSYSVSNVSSFDLFITKLQTDYPRLQLAMSNNLATISWPTTANPFAIQSSTNLNEWFPFGTEFSTNNGRITIHVSPVGTRFFRLAR